MKLELRENMYVRTKKGIAKIKKIFSSDEEPYFGAKYETDTYLEIYYDSEYVSEDDVLKASYNIIDILEVGDYVNGLPVSKTSEYINTYEKYIELYGSCSDWENEDIKSVITHEQMEQMAYKVED